MSIIKRYHLDILDGMAYDHAGGEWVKWVDVQNLLEAAPVRDDFQSRVYDWAVDCFGAEDANHQQMRVHRFLEEATELAQACGCNKETALELVDYVYGRPAGEIAQEVGGTMVSLAVLCQAFMVVMGLAGEAELARVLNNVEKIRQRHAAKPKFGQLGALRALTEQSEALGLYDDQQAREIAGFIWTCRVCQQVNAGWSSKCGRCESAR